jgi:hypothetical protein
VGLPRVYFERDGLLMPVERINCGITRDSAGRRPRRHGALVENPQIGALIGDPAIAIGSRQALRVEILR